MIEEKVRKTLHDMVAVAYGQEKLRGTWVTNRKSIAVFIGNLRGSAGDKKEELTEKLKRNNSIVKWGRRAAVVSNLTPLIWEMKAEVDSAEKAVKIIAQGVWWHRKRYEVELWRNAKVRAMAGGRYIGRGNVPAGPRGSGPLTRPRSTSGGYQGERPVYGLSNICCYNYQNFGHFAHARMIRTRMTSNLVGERGQKRLGGPGAEDRCTNWTEGNEGWQNRQA